MYKKDRFRQFGLTDFNQPLGLKMNPENRWVRYAATIPWEAIEEKYSQRAFSLAKRSYGLGRRSFFMAIFEIDFFKVQSVQKYFWYTIFDDNSSLKNQAVVEQTLITNRENNSLKP